MAGTESLPTPQDTNQNFALIGVQGTAGTADTRGTSVTMPISVDPLTGAMNVKDLSGAAGTTNVQVLGGSVVVTAGTTKITDGTQVANTLAGDTGQNPLLQAGIRKELSFTTTTVQAVGTADVSNYRSVSVHIVTQGASSTITFQGSNDNTNWVSLALVQPSNTLSSPSTSTSSAGVMFVGNLSFRYFRLNVTGIASGTTAGVIEFFSEPMSNLTSIAGQIAINGTQAVAMSSGTLNAGTINMINAGTLTSSGTTTGVGVVTNLTSGSVRITVGTITTGTIVNSGTTTGVGVVTSVTNLASGTLLSSGTTTGVGVVTSVTNLASGTLLSSGTTTGVGVVTSLTQGSINVTAGTITAGTFSLNPLAGSVLTTLVAMGTAGTAAIPTTALSGRKALIAYNSGTTTVYIGGSGVSTASGIPIPINSYTPSFDLGTGVLYGIGGGGTLTALEIS